MRLLSLILLTALLLGCAGNAPAGNDTNGTSQIQVVNCPAICGSGGPQVCGTDGKTYQNKCQADCMGAAIAGSGACATMEGGCSDSDGGQDIYTKGTAKIPGQSSTDRCKSADILYEFFCGPGAVKNETITCPSGFGCDDGACVVPVGSASTCQGGKRDDLLTKGTVTSGGTAYADACQGESQVKKFYCDNGKIASETKGCPSGYNCGEGRCYKRQSACRETDSGNDMYAPGTLTITTAQTSAEYLDKCLDYRTLKEYYCVGDGYASQTVGCPQGYTCAQDACRQPLCTDTDNGYSIYQKGAVSKGDISSTDNCANTHQGIEYFCQDNQVMNASFDCPAGYVCRNGGCER
jgi:hypothetical protein